MVTNQEIEYLHRIEEVLGFPKGSLVKALIRDRADLLASKTVNLYDKTHNPDNRVKNQKACTANR